MSAHLLILDFFLDQVDVSADYVLVRDFRGAMSCLSPTLSITFLLSCSLHFTGFSLLSRKAAMVTVLLFPTAPRYLHRILSAKRSTSQGIRQDRPPLSVFLLIIMIGSRCLQFVIPEPTSRKKKTQLGRFHVRQSGVHFLDIS